MTNELRLKHIEFIQNDIKERGEFIASDIDILGSNYYVMIRKEEGGRRKTIRYFGSNNPPDGCRAIIIEQ